MQSCEEGVHTLVRVCVCVLGGGWIIQWNVEKKWPIHTFSGQWCFRAVVVCDKFLVVLRFAAWFDVDTEKSTHVYVSGLPSDLTDEEFNELMAKCGLIMFDPHTHKPKVKLYRNADGSLKGDGRCCYIKVMMWTLISLFISRQWNVNVAFKGIVIPVFLLKEWGELSFFFFFLLKVRDQLVFFQRSVSFLFFFTEISFFLTVLVLLVTFSLKLENKQIREYNNKNNKHTNKMQTDKQTNEGISRWIY